jgi:hypothetical protein
LHPSQYFQTSLHEHGGSKIWQALVAKRGTEYTATYN